jgi:hypothetical protein
MWFLLMKWEYSILWKWERLMTVYKVDEWNVGEYRMVDEKEN